MCARNVHVLLACINIYNYMYCLYNIIYIVEAEINKDMT